MARITLFWCFEKKIFLSRMMEFQVKFCYHSELRLWRTGMLLSTKSKCPKSNVHISWMYRYRFYDLKVHFWWPNKCLFSYKPSLNTLYSIFQKNNEKIYEFLLQKFIDSNIWSGRRSGWRLLFHFREKRCIIQVHYVTFLN